MRVRWTVQIDNGEVWGDDIAVADKMTLKASELIGRQVQETIEKICGVIAPDPILAQRDWWIGRSDDERQGLLLRDHAGT